MTIRHLHIFTEVCRTQSITLAAEHLNMTQPAVSTAIRELETYYGVNLFDRMNRRIYITDAGNLLLDHANAILAELDATRGLIRECSAAGTLRIGSNIAFAVSFLADALEEFSVLHPEINLYTRIEKPRIIEDALLQNELDFIIGDKLSDHSAFCCHHLIHEEVRLICTPQLAKTYFADTLDAHRSADSHDPDSPHPILELSQLAEVPLLLREGGSGARNTLDLALRSIGVEPRIVGDSANSQALFQLCKKGFGAMLLPVSQIELYREEPALTEFSFDTNLLDRDYYLSYHKNKQLTRAMRWFIQHMTGK